MHSACMQAEPTIPVRKQMLTRKQEKLRQSIRKLEESVAYIDWKQNFSMKCFPGRDLTKATLSGNKENGRQNLWQMCRRTTLPQKCVRPDMNG